MEELVFIRSEMEDLEIFQAAIKSKLMNMGVQTRAAVDKYYMDNCDGAMTKGDEYEITKLRQKLVQKEEELLTLKKMLGDCMQNPSKAYVFM